MAGKSAETQSDWVGAGRRGQDRPAPRGRLPGPHIATGPPLPGPSGSWIEGWSECVAGRPSGWLDCTLARLWIGQCALPGTRQDCEGDSPDKCERREQEKLRTPGVRLYRAGQQGKRRYCVQATLENEGCCEPTPSTLRDGVYYHHDRGNVNE